MFFDLEGNSIHSQESFEQLDDIGIDPHNHAAKQDPIKKRPSGEENASLSEEIPQIEEKVEIPDILNHEEKLIHHDSDDE